MTQEFQPEDLTVLPCIHDLVASEIVLNNDTLTFRYKGISKYDVIKQQNICKDNLDLIFILENIDDDYVSLRTHKSLMYRKKITLRGRDYTLREYVTSVKDKELPLQHLRTLVSWKHVSMINEGRSGRSTFNLFVSRITFNWY